jgi:hypothetical protein
MTEISLFCVHIVCLYMVELMIGNDLSFWILYTLKDRIFAREVTFWIFNQLESLGHMQTIIYYGCCETVSRTIWRLESYTQHMIVSRKAT